VTENKKTKMDLGKCDGMKDQILDMDDEVIPSEVNSKNMKNLKRNFVETITSTEYSLSNSKHNPKFIEISSEDNFLSHPSQPKPSVMWTKIEEYYRKREKCYKWKVATTQGGYRATLNITGESPYVSEISKNIVEAKSNAAEQWFYCHPDSLSVLDEPSKHLMTRNTSKVKSLSETKLPQERQCRTLRTQLTDVEQIIILSDSDSGHNNDKSTEKTAILDSSNTIRKKRERKISNGNSQPTIKNRTNEKKKGLVVSFSSKSEKKSKRIRGTMDFSEEETSSRKKLKTSKNKFSLTGKRKLKSERIPVKVALDDPPGNALVQQVSGHAEVANAIQTEIGAMNSSPSTEKHEELAMNITEGTGVVEKTEKFRCSICGHVPNQPNRSELYRHYAVKHFYKVIMDLVKNEVKCPVCHIDMTNVKSTSRASHLGQRHDWVEKFLPNEAIIPRKTHSGGKRLRPKRNTIAQVTLSMEKDSNASTFEEAHGIGLDEAGNPIPVTLEFDDLCSDIICAICKRECFTVAHTVMHVRDEHQIRGLDDVEASFLQLTIRLLRLNHVTS